MIVPLFQRIVAGSAKPHAEQDADHAIAAPLQPADELAQRGSVDRRVLALQVEKLDGSLLSGCANIPVAVVVAFMIRGDVPAERLYLWIMMMVTAIAGHICAVRGPLPWRVDRGWHKHGLRTRLAVHVAFTTLVGAVWGGACLAFGPSLSQNLMMLLTIIVLGCNAACISALGGYLPAFFGFYVASLVPLAYATFDRQEPEASYLTVLALIYPLTLMLNVRGYSHNVVAAFRLQSENEILAADVKRADAQTAAEMRSKWDTLAHLSHELRTPMNAIIGFSELMREQLFGPIGERYLSYCAHIDDSGRHAIGLIDAILDVSQAEAGRVSLTESEMPPSALVEECLRMVGIAAAAKRVTLDSRFGLSIPRVAGDRAKLRQALLNLLTNAIKYTPDGGRVHVDTRMVDDGLDIAVTDTGVGIASDDLERCFEPFVRLRNPLTAGVAGVGLGLSLAKHMVELHGGSLRIASELGRGTVATLHVPVERCLAA